MEHPAALAAVLALAAALAVPAAHAEVSVAGASGSTILLDVAAGTTGVSIWLPEGSSFTECKAVAGWECSLVGGTAEFASSGMSGGKLAVITDAPVTEFYWSSSGPGGDAGPSTHRLGGAAEPEPEPEPDPEPDPEPRDETPAEPPAPAGPSPSFRVIPASTSAGGAIRVVGEHLEPSTRYDLYIDRRPVGTFTSDGSGYFAGTSVVPRGASGISGMELRGAGGVLEGEIRIGEGRRQAPSWDVSASADPAVAGRGEQVSLSGTAAPGSRVTIDVADPRGIPTWSLVAGTGPDGRWSADPIHLGFDAPFGTYVAAVTDGEEHAAATWAVATDSVMDLHVRDDVVPPGGTLVFYGTAMPGEELVLAVEGPAGTKVSAEVLVPDANGTVLYEYATPAGGPGGPYTLVATQAGQTGFVHAYSGERDEIYLNLELDRGTYSRGESARVSVSGEPGGSVNLVMIGEKGGQGGIKHESAIRLGPEGTAVREVDLGPEFTPGTYIARLSKGNVIDEEVFGVDLAFKNARLSIGPVDEEYAPGEQILIRGSTFDSNGLCSGTAANILITVRLVDPRGVVERQKHTFIDGNCGLIDRTFGIPEDAELGTWKIVSNIRGEVLRSGLDIFTNRTAAAEAAPVPESYDGCVPATDLGKLVLLACRIGIGGDNVEPVLRLVDKDGNIVWQEGTPLVDEIFEKVGAEEIFRYVDADPVNREPIVPDCRCKLDEDTKPLNTWPPALTVPKECKANATPSPSNRTGDLLLDLGGIELVSCPHGVMYEDPVPSCTGGYDGQTRVRPNATVDTDVVGRQVILYKCDDRWGAAVNATRTVVIIDATPPEIRLTGRHVDEHFLNNAYVDPGATCLDAADPNPVIRTLSLLNIAKLGEHKILYRCTDASGNFKEATRTVNILDPCDINSYKKGRDGNIGRNIIGCGKDNKGAGGGATLIESPFRVVGDGEDLLVHLEERRGAGTSRLVDIVVSGALGGAEIVIVHESGAEVQRQIVSGPGHEATYTWLVDRHMEPGAYMITAYHGGRSADAEYHIPLEYAS